MHFYKKAISLFLCTIMLFFSFPFGVSAEEPLNESEFAVIIEELKIKYPDDTYWSNKNGTVTEGPLAGSSLAGGSSCGSHSWSANCGTFMLSGRALAWQCMGYAFLIAYEIFGSYAKEWPVYYDSTRQIYAGDVIRIDSNGNGIAESSYDHSIFVYRVTDTHIYYTDCNRKGPCKIDWDGVMTFSELKSKFLYVNHYEGNTLDGSGTDAPTLTLTFGAGGGDIPETERYKLTTDGLGLRLRAEPTLSSSVLIGMPDGIEIRITETLESGGYIWGKTSYNGHDGWCAIAYPSADEVYAEPVGFYVDLDSILLYPDGDAYMSTMKHGALSYTLPSAEDFGLFRDGYEFIGWKSSFDASGELFLAGKSYSAEQICPAISSGDMAMTVYAYWRDLTPPVYIFSFDGAGAVGEMEPLKHSFGDMFVFPQSELVLEKMTFDGWSLKRDTDGKWLSEDAGWCTTEELVLTENVKKKFVRGEVILIDELLTDELDVDISYTVIANWRERTAVEAVIERLPDKTEYYVGDTLDTTGLEIKLVYDNAETDVISDGYELEYDLTSAGEAVVLVKYMDLTCEFLVNVALKEPVPETPENTVYGDATGDGIVDNKDLVRLKKFLAEYDYDTETSSVEISFGADATGDGETDGKDLVRLKKYLAAYDYETGGSDITLGPERS